MVFYVVSLVFYVCSLVSFGFSLDLVVSLRAYWVLYWLFSGLIWFSIAFTVGLARLYCSKLQCFLSLAHSGEGGRSSPEMPPDAPELPKLQNDCFSKLFVRVSGRGSGRGEKVSELLRGADFSAFLLSRVLRRK